uniref:Glycosyl-4,4'-diaponeurosporenoate acyltransferase n=1 Tax=Angiostrongylus cantonensis TaxID=6313 RepID=A0A0K0D9T5_ANGCA
MKSFFERLSGTFIAGYINYVYDVTIGFGDCIVQSEVDFFAHGLSNWLIDLWKEKEEKLRRFYSVERERREFENTPGGKDYTMSNIVFATELAIVLFWFMVTAFWLYGFLAVPYVFSFSVLSCSIFILIQRQWGGVEWLSIESFNYSEKLQTY